MNIKVSLLAILLISGFLTVSAQAPIGIGEFQINAGLGFSNSGVPIYGGFDVGVHEDITVGGELSFRAYDDSWDGTTYNHSMIGIAGNANYHLNTVLEIPSEWDVYGGLNLGFYIVTSDSGYGGPEDSSFGLGAQVGGRYYFNEKYGINLEFGGGSTFSGGKIGISIKL
jgi:outer membrane immunogenic protein